METLERIQTRHKAILMTFNQVESILAPIHTGVGKYDNIIITPFNLERLAKHSDLLSSEFCGVKVIEEQKERRFAANYKPSFETIYKVNIEDENLSYTFIPELICDVKNRVEKSFRAAEAMTKKVIKPQPRAREREYIYPDAGPIIGFTKARKKALINKYKKAEMSINNINLLINDNKTLQSDSKKNYICSSIDEMKTVNFQIEGKYIDQIKAGTKGEEYRAINPVNAKKLCDHIDKKDLQPGEQFVTHNKEIWRLKKELTHVRLFNGYKTDRKELLIELKGLELNKYTKVIPDGMKPGTICFTLILGQIVVSKNFKDENQ